MLDVNQQSAENTCEQIEQRGGTATAHVCDVTNQPQVKSTFADLFNRERIHILVNNAGVSHIGTVESTRELISTGLFG